MKDNGKNSLLTRDLTELENFLDNEKSRLLANMKNRDENEIEIKRTNVSYKPTKSDESDVSDSFSKNLINLMNLMNLIILEQTI